MILQMGIPYTYFYRNQKYLRRSENNVTSLGMVRPGLRTDLKPYVGKDSDFLNLR